MSRYASQRQILAKLTLTDGQSVTGITAADFVLGDGYFNQVQGGQITASVQKVFTGKSLFAETICAPAEIGDITLTNFSRNDANFLALMNKLRQYVGRVYFNITISVFDCDLAVPGLDRVYNSALLTGLTESDGDASSGNPATFALVFSISSISAHA